MLPEQSWTYDFLHRDEYSERLTPVPWELPDRGTSINFRLNVSFVSSKHGTCETMSGVQNVECN